MCIVLKGTTQKILQNSLIDTNAQNPTHTHIYIEFISKPPLGQVLNP